MAKVIIAIHGLRNKPPKELLEKWGLEAIKEGFRSEGYRVNLPKFELVYWADILYDKPLSPDEKNPESPYYIDEPYRPAPENRIVISYRFRRKIVRLLKKVIYKIMLKKDFELRYPFLSKTFIHNNFKDLEVYFAENCDKINSKDCQLRDQINQRLIDVLKKYQNYEILLIAHSMGSIIAFDVLSFIMKDAKVHTLITIGSPLGAPFVLSRIAEYSKKENNGIIKLQTPETVYKHWYNFSDIRDSIAMDYKLAEEFDANSKGVKVVDKLVVNTYSYKKKINPHKSYGYLRTPELIAVLKEFIDNEDILSSHFKITKHKIAEIIKNLLLKKKR